MTEMIHKLPPGVCACRLRAYLIETIRGDIGDSKLSANVYIYVDGSTSYGCGVSGCPKIMTLNLSVNDGIIDEKATYTLNNSGNCILNS